MALDLAARYPGQVDTDAAYPQGKARNVVTAGDGTGTPLERDLVNDIIGFHQALLLNAGLAPSGSPDSGTSSQYLQSFYRLLGRADGWGALGDDSANDTTALQNGINAVAARGPERQAFHFVDGKIYRMTGLTVPKNVDLFFHGAKLVNTHATNAWLTYEDGGLTVSEQYQQVTDVTFVATIATTGAAINLVDEATKLLVRNAWYGDDSNSQGKFLDASAVGGDVRLEAVTLRGNADVQLVHITGGKLILEDVRVKAPPTHTGALIEIGAVTGFADKLSFDLGSHTSGILDCVRVTSSSARVEIGTMQVASGGLADRCLAWTAAAFIVELGIRTTGAAVMYNGSTTLSSGSRLSLRAHRATTYAGATCALPAGVARAVTRSTEASGAISLEFPTGFYPGQPFELLLSTTHSGGVTVPSITGAVPVTHAATVGIIAGYVQSAPFVWMDPAGGTSYEWVQTGPWIGVN